MSIYDPFFKIFVIVLVCAFDSINEHRPIYNL